MKVSFPAAGASRSADAVVVLAFEKSEFSAPAAELDAATDGALKRAIEASRFTGAPGDSLELLAPSGVDHDRILLLGAGPASGLAAATERLGAAAVRALLVSGARSAAIRLDVEGLDPAAAARAGLGARLAAYRWDAYRTKLASAKRPSLESFAIHAPDAKAAKAAWTRWEAVADGVDLARDLVSEPANVMYPEAFAAKCRDLAADGVEVEVLGEKAMEKLGMNTLLSVGRGSARESQLVVMKWNGGDSAAPVAFVGKGVCFDTGGVSLKPGEGMWDMKGDKGGAAAVTGAMKALAMRKAKVNVVGVIGLVENMPDGQASRPGDIVTSMSGQTVEILNTDAEGRLVLADALHYTKETFKPSCMIDLATLTGAMIITLANEYAGLFSNDDALANELIAAGEASQEKVWRMPMAPAYDKLIDSKNADMKNIGGRAGGSITAAQFLKRFVGDTPWAHLDIAPTAWKDKSEDPREPVWATGWGVRILERFIADARENK
jgi:leucyl aminopeptidase